MQRKKLLSLCGLKWNPFTPDVPTEALLATPRIESFCRRVENMIHDGGFALVTGDPHKRTAEFADLILFVPASVYLGTADVVPSVQPMGNLFEQALLITFDMIIMILRDRLGITPEEMEKMHRNLE